MEGRCGENAEVSWWPNVRVRVVGKEDGRFLGSGAGKEGVALGSEVGC